MSIDLAPCIRAVRNHLGTECEVWQGEDVLGERELAQINFARPGRKLKGGIWIYSDGSVFCNTVLRGIVADIVLDVLSEIRRQRMIDACQRTVYA